MATYESAVCLSKTLGRGHALAHARRLNTIFYVEPEDHHDLTSYCKIRVSQYAYFFLQYQIRE